MLGPFAHALRLCGSGVCVLSLAHVVPGATHTDCCGEQVVMDDRVAAWQHKCELAEAAHAESRRELDLLAQEHARVLDQVRVLTEDQAVQTDGASLSSAVSTEGRQTFAHVHRSVAPALAAGAAPSAPSAEWRAQLEAIFHSIDANGDGQLSAAEVIKALRVNPVVARMLGLDHVRQEDGSRDVFERIFQEIDMDHNRKIDKSEFVAYFLRQHGPRAHSLPPDVPDASSAARAAASPDELSSEPAEEPAALPAALPALPPVPATVPEQRLWIPIVFSDPQAHESSDNDVDATAQQMAAQILVSELAQLSESIDSAKAEDERLKREAEKAMERWCTPLTGVDAADALQALADQWCERAGAEYFYDRQTNQVAPGVTVTHPASRTAMRIAPPAGI